MKYRKKPIEVEAIRFDGDNFEECVEFMGRSKMYLTNVGQLMKMIGEKNIRINTLEGEMTASKGDYIIRGINGEYYPCKPDIFEKTYELVRE